MTKEEQYLQTGAYALDALSLDETSAFERALADSPELAIEAEELRATATLMALAATPVQPSDDLKVRLMAQIARTPQAPRHAGSFIEPGESFSSAQDAPHSVTERDSVSETFAPRSAATVKAHTRWFARPVGALVAAAAAVAIFVGGGVVGTQFLQNNSSNSEQASASALAEIYAAPDVQTAHSTVAGGGEATVLWSAQVGKSAVVAQGLPSLPEGKTYEAWYINGNAATPAGTFTPGGDATTWHVLTGTLGAGDTVGVTVEPAGGSQSPTTTPILAVTSS
ncbi:anti-sigma factor [Subtercola boreus]|uniref:Regulator of SigK n=1 Tax=Subtercola boreus TaxID=120213 RepID=A0A3E0WBC1_9MICO|nr:anti-sigma factor [Subtercola boreus]RFA19347.1 hypothetical protein B7R24_11905 [Subtercola boreus]RFA19608.1 hypothetical protein B7R23_11885 [Subtercola boreus]RFA25973.1 hypothetical protein B7R25_12005 [Subtercola boreus]